MPSREHGYALLTDLLHTGGIESTSTRSSADEVTVDVAYLASLTPYKRALSIKTIRT
jgi:hypothetical protein